MAITTQIPLTTSMASNGYYGFDGVTLVTEKTPEVAIDFPFYVYECCYDELAFWAEGGNPYQNDKKSFLVDIQDPNGTYTLTLMGEGQSVNLNNNNILGTPFALGDLEQPTKAGYIIDWKKVNDNLGSGIYCVKVEVNEFGKDLVQNSHNFRVMQFSLEAADGTIRLDSINSGFILNGTNYVDMTWPRWLRLAVEFNEVAPELEIENLLTSQYRPSQVQQKTRDQYTIKTGLIPSGVYEQLKSDLKSDQLTLNTYDIFGFRKLENTPIALTEISELKTSYAQTRSGVVEFSLQNKKLELKRNI